MAPRVDDVSVSPTGGAICASVAKGRTTTLGVFVQLRGVAVTSATAECVVTRGAESVTLTPTIASGEVTAPLTDADLTTLGAEIGSLLTVWWRGTVTDGATTHTWEYEERVGVSDRALRFPIDYARLTSRLTQMSKACAVPSNQTTFWEQIRLAMGDLRDRIDSEQADVKTYLLGREGTLRQIAEAFALVEVIGVMVGQTNGQGDWLSKQYAYWMQERDARWSRLILSVRDTSAWQTEGTSREALADPPARRTGRAKGVGGYL